MSGTQAEPPPSAARLAAEAAFSMPSRPTGPANEPIVVVRRARILVIPPSAPEMEGAEAPELDPGSKGPRVFRLQGKPEVAVESREPQNIDDEWPSAPLLRRRRTADKRPGPLLQVYEAPAQVRKAKAVSEVALQELAEALEALGPMFDFIRRAQSFQVMDSEPGVDWSQWMQAAGELRAEIRSQQEQIPIFPPPM